MHRERACTEELLQVEIFGELKAEADCLDEEVAGLQVVVETAA